MSKVRVLHGRVLSSKMDKTVVVVINRCVKHALYGKFVKRTTKLHVHDEYNHANVGDLVLIKECRPVSKIKSWRLVSAIKS